MPTPTVFALILDVMDGEQRLDIVIPRVLGIEQIVVYGNQRCLPVVGVDEVGMEVDVGEHLEDRAREERIALGVVIEAVQLVALEIILVVDKIIGAVIPASPEETAVLVSPRNRNGEVGDEIHLAFQLIGDRAIKRHDDSAVMTLTAS